MQLVCAMPPAIAVRGRTQADYDPMRRLYGLLYATFTPKLSIA